MPRSCPPLSTPAVSSQPRRRGRPAAWPPGQAPQVNHRHPGGGRRGYNGGRPGAARGVGGWVGAGWGGDRGIWGKGRVWVSASYFNSLTPCLPAPPGPGCCSAPVLPPPSALASPPAGASLPSPARRGAALRGCRRRCSAPVLFGWVSLMADRRRQCCRPTAGGQTRDRGQLTRRLARGRGSRPALGRRR